MAIVTVFGYLITPHNPFFVGTPVHPYLLVVALMAARYGTVVGVGMAASLALLYELGGLARTGESALPLALVSPHSITLSGIFIFAIIVGSLFDALHHQMKSLERQGQEAKDRLKFFENHNKLLEKTNQELRGRIMEETTTFQTLYEMAKKLSTLEPQFLYSAVLDILEEHLKAESCSFYLLKGNSLHLVAQKGWDEVPSEAKDISSEQGIMGRVIREKKIVTLKDLAYQDEHGFGDKVMAVPVCSQADERMIGVIAIEEIPFDKFNPQTVRALTLIAGWTSKAMANVALFSEAEEGVEERERMLSELLGQMEAGHLPDAAFQQVVTLGQEIIPKIGEILLKPSLKPNQKSNLLTILEHLQRKGKHLSPEVCRTFAIDSLRNWYYLEKCRMAAIDEKREETELLEAYLREQQEQYHSFTGRGLALMFDKRSNRPLGLATDILEGAVKLDKELADLLDTMREGDRHRIEKLNKDRWGYESTPFSVLLPELLASHDPWLKATALHNIHSMDTLQETDLVPLVLESLKDESPIVRETSIKALVRLQCLAGDENIIPLFEDMTKNDSDPQVRIAANNALSVVS